MSLICFMTKILFYLLLLVVVVVVRCVWCKGGGLNIWKSGNNLMDSIYPPHIYEDSKTWPQVARLVYEAAKFTHWAISPDSTLKPLSKNFSSFSLLMTLALKLLCRTGWIWTNDKNCLIVTGMWYQVPLQAEHSSWVSQGNRHFIPKSPSHLYSANPKGSHLLFLSA